MRLYTFAFSPNALKVRLALLELGIAFQEVEVDLDRGEHRTEFFAEINPFRKVPVLEDGDLMLRESNAIVAYLGSRQPTPLWPSEPARAAVATQWLFFEAVHIAPSARTLWWNDVVAPNIQRPGMDAVVVANALKDLNRGLAVLDEHVATHPYVLGDHFSLADLCLAVSTTLFRHSRADDPERWPHLVAYRDRIRARPSWQQLNADHVFRIA